jgi:hypothetical protein
VTDLVGVEGHARCSHTEGDSQAADLDQLSPISRDRSVNHLLGSDNRSASLCDFGWCLTNRCHLMLDAPTVRKCACRARADAPRPGVWGRLAAREGARHRPPFWSRVSRAVRRILGGLVGCAPNDPWRESAR